MWMSTYKCSVTTTKEEYNNTVVCLLFLILNKFGFKKCSIQYCWHSFFTSDIFKEGPSELSCREHDRYTWKWDISAVLVSQTWRALYCLVFQNDEQLLMGLQLNKVHLSWSLVAFLENSLYGYDTKILCFFVELGFRFI